MRTKLAFIVLGLAIFLAPAQSFAADTSALINEAMDKLVSFQLEGVLPQVMSKIEEQTAVPIRVPVNVPRNASVAEALESLTKDDRTDATWYPWGKSIVIVPREQVVLQQLRKTINRRFNNTELSQVLTELSQAAGIDFELEAGALQ